MPPKKTIPDPDNRKQVLIRMDPELYAELADLRHEKRMDTMQDFLLSILRAYVDEQRKQR